MWCARQGRRSRRDRNTPHQRRSIHQSIDSFIHSFIHSCVRPSVFLREKRYTILGEGLAVRAVRFASAGQIPNGVGG